MHLDVSGHLSIESEHFILTVFADGSDLSRHENASRFYSAQKSLEGYQKELKVLI